MNANRTWPLVVALLGQLGVSVPSVARAATPAVADSAAVEEALERFRGGVTLYEEGDTAGALAELQRAYELAPNPKILYNLGQISYQSRDYAAALGYFRRYLIDGGEQVPEARRREVEGEIRTLKRRTGHIEVLVPEGGSSVSMDDVPSGTSPVASPLLANVGRHRLDVTSPSGQRRTRVVDVAGGETVTVRFEAALPSLPAAVSSAPAVRGTDLTTSARPTDVGSASRGGFRPWVSWTLTAALAVGAGVTGGLALYRSSQAQDALNTFPVSKSDLDDLRSQQHTLALVSDGLLVSALVMAGVSLYLGRSTAPEDAVSSPRQTALARSEP